MKKMIFLPDDERVSPWYNGMPDIPNGMMPPLNPATKQPLTPNEPKTILFNLSGHGLLDLASYDKYFAYELHNFDYPEAAVEAAKKYLPVV